MFTACIVVARSCIRFHFFFNDTATTEIYTLSLHDALPIYGQGNYSLGVKEQIIFPEIQYDQVDQIRGMDLIDRKSTRLNSSHANISYAVFCLKKKKKEICYKHTCVLN